MVEIRLLGPVEARDGERVLPVQRKKQRALLAALALRVGEAVSTDRLVDDLWGERAPRTARHALENYVSELRKALGPEAIATRPGGYALEVAPEQVDAVQFERLVASAREGTAEERSEALGRALALVRGPPLADVSFEPFAAPAIGRLEELELGAREGLFEAELELGRHTDVVGELERLVVLHPYRERLRAQLMLALYRSGRQVEALAAYQEARRVLVDELGIDPGAELQDLERAILRQDPSLRPPPRVQPATRSAEAVPPRRAQRKIVTVLAVELGNAAALAERLDPEPLRALLDRYGELAAGVVERHEGTCAMRGGERVLALFGVPVSHEDDAHRALQAAVEIRDGVGKLNDGLLPQHGVFLEVRSALGTGEALVGADTDELATGHVVAVVEELARSARPGQILLSDSSLALVHDGVVVEAVEEAPDAKPAHRLVELRPDRYGRPLRLDSPLVGRRRQLSTLASAFERAATDGSAHLFTLLGPAGVGKSRLVREFVDGLGDLALVLRGRCLPYGEPSPYSALLEALRGGGLADPDAAGARAELERLAAERPLVLVLDDLQWGEAPLHDLVEALAEELRAVPVLLLCVARPELLDARPAWGGGKPNASSLLLEPLTEAESERLMDNLLGESELPDAIRAYVVRTAEGNPLFVEELLATLVERAVLRREAGRWTTTEVAAIPLPPTVQALIDSRIDRLPAPERAVLELASVEGGRVFRRDVVAALGPELAAALDRHLLALVRRELVRPQPEGEGSYAFRHQLIRDAAYGSMPKRLRAELHERLADLLESSEHVEGDDARVVAHHRDRAREYRASLEIGGDAGR